MKLQSLVLQHYRNIPELSLRFEGSIIGFLGKNAQGKTNLLESIYTLSHGESWRTHTDAELIEFDSSYCRVDTTVEESALSLVVERVPQSHLAKKSYLVNGIRRRKDTFTSHFAAILFHPEELDVVTGSPSSRRSLLDISISHAFSDYSHHLSQYGKIVTSRNRLLEHVREGIANKDQLDYWTTILINHGVEIYVQRYTFFKFISSLDGSNAFTYVPKIEVDFSDDTNILRSRIRDSFTKRIEENLFKEIQSGATQYGPHKDDFIFYKNGRNLSMYGSRGEQREGVFAFKKVQLQYIQKHRQVTPVLLLDDIFSEFDLDHRVELSELIRGYQTFVTGTEPSFFKSEGIHFDQIFTVSEGSVS